MLSILALSLIQTASAGGGGSPYMWGVGPEVGSIILPFQHPIAWPRITVTDANGEEDKVRLGGETDSFDKTGGDVLLGGRGALYLNKRNRFVGQLGFGLGSGDYRSAEGTVEYNVVPLSENGVEAFVGAGLGLGRMSWSTHCPNDLETSCPDDVEYPGDLSMSTFLLRGSAGVMFRQPRNSYELSLFAHYVVPGNVKYTSQTTSDEQDANLGFYPYIGLAGTVYFGDFKPPGEGGGKKKKKNGGDGQ